MSLNSLKLSRLAAVIATLSVSVGISTSALASSGNTEAYPTRAVSIVDGFAPGGSTDSLIRIVAQHLSKSLGQPVIVENKAGAGGVVATTYVSRAKPDGYTLLIGTIGPIVVNPHMIATLGYKPLQDLKPVVSLVDVANVLVVQNAHPAKDVVSLIELANSKPGVINYGSAGIGTTAHLAGEVFQQQTNTKLTHVPYRGGAPAMIGLLAGETDLIFSSIPTAVEHVKGGTLRALAVTGPTPLAALPGVLPMKDAGITGYDLPSWYGIFAPAGTPDAVVAKLEKEIAAVMALPEVAQQLIALGMAPNVQSSAEFSKQITRDYDYWKGVIEKANITLN